MNTPKFFEHQRRDASATVTLGHCCDEVTSNTKIPPRKWRENFINCRECKQSLVRFVGTYFLNNIGTYLQPQQTLYVAGAYDGVEVDTAWFVRGNNCKQPDPAFSSNAEETDIRLWLHARKTSCANILIMSPDTDVYHIGLPLKMCDTKTNNFASKCSQFPPAKTVEPYRIGSGIV